jgi:molybdenum cofactor guanylyltransferase
MIKPNNIHAVVLAGGEGRRMGGADKGLVLFRGQALAQRAAQRIAPFVGAVSVSANRHANEYAALGLTVFGDELANYEGPLGGILAALTRCTAPYVLVLPCDVPFFPDDLTPRLATALGTHPTANVAMVRALQAHDDGTTSAHVNPVFMLIRSSALPHLKTFFEGGGRKITAWAALAKLVVVDFVRSEDVLAFADADCLADITRLEHSAAV